jgi:hypothetical protein
MSTTEERRSITARHDISTKAAQLRPTPSSSRGAPPNFAIQDAVEAAMGSNKRCK